MQVMLKKRAVLSLLKLKVVFVAVCALCDINYAHAPVGGECGGTSYDNVCVSWSQNL